MARTKNKEKKTKQMFQPYDSTAVPDRMPLPRIAWIATTKAQTIVVPRLNRHQRSWILDVAIRDSNLHQLSKEEALELYNRVKVDAFEAEAFQHVVQPGDQAEEARMPQLIAAFKPSSSKNDEDSDDESDSGINKNSVNDGPGIADEDSAIGGTTTVDATKPTGSVSSEEDSAARAGYLRGYSKAGWRLAIQKVMSNKRDADKRKAAKGQSSGAAVKVETAPDTKAMSKLLKLATYTGRDRFREERHTEIEEHAQTLTGGNEGGKFRKAEAELWEKEDHAAWDAKVASEDGVNWTERQKLVASGFKDMVTNLHDSHKFRPFLATMLMAWIDEEGQIFFEWTEGIPKEIHVRNAFKVDNEELVKRLADRMHDWADKPLQEYITAQNEKIKPLFMLKAEDLDDISYKKLISEVSTFLTQSYDAAFGCQDIPWGELSNEPSKYYDAELFTLRFSSNGLSDLTRDGWYDLAKMLSSVAGPGTSGFFRKSNVHAEAPRQPPSPPSPPPRSPTPAVKDPETRAQSVQPPSPQQPSPAVRSSETFSGGNQPPPLPPSPPTRSPTPAVKDPKIRAQSEQPPNLPLIRSSPTPPPGGNGGEVPPAPPPPPSPPLQSPTPVVVENMPLSSKLPIGEGVNSDPAPKSKPRVKKRKAEDPVDMPAPREGKRVRKTPAQAQLEREQKAIANRSAPRGKPGWHYEEVHSPKKSRK